MKTLTLDLKERSYGITVGAGALSRAGELMRLDRKTFIVTDSGVPKEYAEKIKAQAECAVIYTVPEGESSKSLDMLGKVLAAMLDFGLSRSDCAVAVGGGVVGDLTGFAAAVYMRGIDFYNVPTTLLAQVDSSIGGKTAVDLNGVKNTVGAFYQPKHVLIDTDVLKTLPKRQISAGLAEAVKMAVTSDAELFCLLEREGATQENIEEIILRALKIKRDVVESDERECGIRKILNFGHTFGHGIEAAEGLYGLYHGECVALGMVPMCSREARERLIPVLEKLGLPTVYGGDVDRALSFVVHDKKCKNGTVEAIFADRIGEYRIERLGVREFAEHIKKELCKL